MGRVAARGALRSILIGTPGLPTERAWEAREYDPVPGTAFVRETLRFPDRHKAGMGRGGLIQQPFVYFVDLFYPQNTLLRVVDIACDAALGAFYPGRRVVAPDVSGVVQSSTAEEVRPDAVWLHAPITVRGWYMEPAPDA